MHQFPQDHVTLNNIVMMLKIHLWSQKYILTDIDIVIIFNFYCIFDQINATLASRGDFFEKH